MVRDTGFEPVTPTIDVYKRQLYDGSLLQVGRSTNSRETVLQPFRLNFLLVMTPTLVLAVLGGAFFAHRATKPVRDVVATARTISDTGDFSARVTAQEMCIRDRW